MVQTIVLVSSVLLLGLLGIILKSTFYFWLPKYLKTAFEFSKDRIFWNLPLRILLQQYMMVTMSIFLNIRYRSTEGLENQVNRAAAWLTLVFYSVLFPLAVMFVTYRYNYLWFQEQFNRRFGSLTLALYVQSACSAMMYGLNMLRQFSIIFIAVTSDQCILQITATLYLQELYTFYQFKEKPMKDPWRRHVEYFNETLLFL